MQDPLKQGLKLARQIFEIVCERDSNARSTKTRIETLLFLSGLAQAADSNARSTKTRIETV